MQYDLLIKNVHVVRPNEHSARVADIAIVGEKFAKIKENIPPGEAKSTYDGKGWLAFPGVVDAHMHTGIYAPLAEDALSESRAAAQGGVTSSLNYFRSGQYYLNKGGPYRQFFPEVLELSAGASTSTTAITSRRWTARTFLKFHIWWKNTASLRSRFSCSTARTGCTAARTASASS